VSARTAGAACVGPVGFGSAALAAYSLRRSAGGATPLIPNLGRPSSCRGAEVAHLPALPRGSAPDFRRARRLTLRHQSVSTRRRFRATTAHSPGRLPSMGSSTLHRGSTHALPFNRLHAFALHPFRENELAPARHEQTRGARIAASSKSWSGGPACAGPPGTGNLPIRAIVRPLLAQARAPDRHERHVPPTSTDRLPRTSTQSDR